MTGQTTPAASSSAAWTPSERELQRRGVRRRQRTRRILLASGLTALVLVVLVLGVRSTPGWPRVRETFFDSFHARESFDAILHGFWINVKLFLICQPIILAAGLAIALARKARSPWLVPVRALAVLYTDVVRGVPTILLIVLFAFGFPALDLQGLPIDPLFWCGVALVVSYSAYVAEVFRSGIDSIHPSQVQSAAALGLSRGQAMRFVVVPQAVRRVVPPLLNDFVSLQKDTALVSTAGALDALFAARNYANFNFNYTPIVVVAAFFVVITIPLARWCDWLQRRWMERERAGAL